MTCTERTDTECEAGDELIVAALDAGAGLLNMGGHVQGWFEAAASGATTLQVMRHALVPVLMMP